MNRWTIAHLSLSAALGSFVTAIAIILAQIILAQPPVRWTYLEPLPTAPLCPGAVIDYRIGMEVNRAGILYVIPAIRRAADHPAVIVAASDARAQAGNRRGLPTIGDTAAGVLGSNVFYTAFAPDEVPGYLVDIDTSLTIPDLPPGPYNRIVAAGLSQSLARPAIRVQRFTIAEDCP